jgi:hypothetical protein
VEVLSIPKIRISIKTLLPILAAILLIGGGNWFITKSIIGAWRFVMAILTRGFDLGKLEVGTKETNAKR